MSDSRLVYSTDAGRVNQTNTGQTPPDGDGIVRIYRQTKGRKGKGVSTIEGLALEAEPLKTLAKAMKKSMGVGGSVKNFTIEMQTDDRDKLKAFLEKKGFKVKIAGG